MATTRALLMLLLLAVCGTHGAGQSAAPGSTPTAEVPGAATPAHLTHPVEPAYPAAVGGVGGVVVVRCRVSADGVFSPSEVLSSPHEALAEKAVEALTGARGTPATDQSGAAVESTLDVEVEFPELSPELLAHPSDEEYPVYSAVFPCSALRVWVLRGHTGDTAGSNLFDVDQLKARFAKDPAVSGLLDGELLQSFRVMRRLSTPLDRFRLAECRVPDGAWPLTQDPLRILVSRIGFNRDRTVALVAVRYGLFAEGQYVLLVRQDGNWRVRARSAGSVS